MKNTCILTVLFCALTIPAVAAPFTVRTILASYDYDAKVEPFLGTALSSVPVLVEIRPGRRAWYGGGAYLTTFPYNPVQPDIALPVLTVSGFPGLTQKPETGVPCDVDRDGDMDIVRMNTWQGWAGLHTFQVFLNNGGGSFTNGYRIDTDSSILVQDADHYHIVCADFDRDGDPDVAILRSFDGVNTAPNPDRYEGSLYVRWNDGLGNFPTTTTLQARDLNEFSSLDSGDVDNDGDTDLICDGHTIINSGGTATINSLLFRNSGTGTFTLVNIGDVPARLADLDRDSWLDAGFGLHTRLNNGAGSIDELIGVNFRGAVVKDYTYVDITDDGAPDLITNDGGNLIYRKGSLTGGNTFGQPVIIGALASPAVAIGAGDSDGDGDTDLMLHLQNGTAAFVENRSLHQSAGMVLTGGAGSSTMSVPGVARILAADLDRDGRDEVIALSPAQRKLMVMFGETDGTPSAPAAFRTTAVDPHSAVAADFDRDGRVDVAYTLPGSGEVRMARNTSNTPSAWPDSAIATGLTGVALLATGGLGTYNGYSDLLTGNATTGQVRWLYQASGSWLGQTLLSNSNPAPGCLMPVPATTAPGDEVFTLAGDSTTLFLKGYQLNPAWTALGTNLATPVSTDPLAQVMVWADVTGDGRGEVVFLRGDGDLAYWNVLTATGGYIGDAPSAIRAITALDWDRDGRTDILCAAANGVYLYSWRGAWEMETLIGSGSYNDICPVNLNADGWPDAAVADTTGGWVTFLTNSPRLLDVRQTAFAPVTLTTGQTGIATTMEAVSLGYGGGDSMRNALPDVNAAVHGAKLNFYRATANGSGWTKGQILQPSDVAQIVSSVALVSGATVIASANPAAAPNTPIPMSYSAGSGTLVPVTADTPQSLGIRLTLTPGAAQSVNNRFFVELFGVVDAAQQDGIAAVRPVPLAGIQPVLVTATPVLSALQQWRMNNFGNWQSTGSAANDADPDRDGVPNLVEYVMGRDPNSGSTFLGGNAAPLDLTYTNQQTPMVVNLRTQTTYDSKVRLTIHYSTNLQSWTTLTTRTGNGSWSLAPDSTTLLSGGGRTWFKFSAASTPQNLSQQYFRLKAEEIP